MTRKKLSNLLSSPILIRPTSTSLSLSDLSSAPSLPGIYIFADADHTPRYIGKSINLKSRLHQHFESAKDPDSKAAHFINETQYLYLQPTDSDLLAIILESNLIKIYQPYYNSLAKDDKTTVYITIGNPPNSKIEVVRASDLYLHEFIDPQTQIYGPYLNNTTTIALLKNIRRIFGYCSNPFNSHQKACFYYHLHQCPGACNGTLTPAEYKVHLTKIKVFLSGRFKYLLEKLTKEIKAHAKNQEFEAANQLKRQLNNLEKALYSHNLVGLLTLPTPSQKHLADHVSKLAHPILKQPPHRLECYDMATLNQENTVGVMVVFEDGVPNKSLYRKFIVRSSKPGDPNMMQSILKRRLRHDEWDKPDLILLDGGIPQLSIVSRVIPPDIAVIALSKKRETLHFFNADGSIENVSLPLHNSLLKIFQFARDEAHRYGTKFQQQRREKIALRAIL